MEAGKEMEEGKVAIDQEEGNATAKEVKVAAKKPNAAVKRSIFGKMSDICILSGSILGLMLVLIIIILFAFGLCIYWASVSSPRKPAFSMENFYVPALNRTSNETQNTTIFYDIQLKNRNLQNNIRYGTINLTIYYGQNFSFPIAKVSIPGFKQGFYKKARRRGTVEAVGVPWDTARTEASNGTARFQVNLDTSVKNSIVFWYNRRKTYRVGNSLRVNDKGSLPKKGVKLTRGSRSSAPVRGRYRSFMGGFVGFALLLIWF